jgi:enoyl-CoA hydratase/carnithine racemase
MSEPVRVERRQAVAVVMLDRADRMNALDRASIAALGQIGKELAADAAIRAVIITGAGDRAFCAGADLKERRTMDDDAVRAQLRLYRSELAWVDPFPMPVIAAINGVCLGGGLELALLCDLRVAAEGAVLGLPETSLGIIPGSGGTQRLPRLVGEARAKRMILFAERVSAREALEIGLVDRVTPAGKSVVDDAFDWIEPIRRGAPIALRAALGAIDAARPAGLEAGLERELELYDECLGSEDRREALEAFAAKRDPVFKGR